MTNEGPSEYVPFLLKPLQTPCVCDYRLLDVCDRERLWFGLPLSVYKNVNMKNGVEQTLRTNAVSEDVPFSTTVSAFRLFVADGSNAFETNQWNRSVYMTGDLRCTKSCEEEGDDFPPSAHSPTPDRLCLLLLTHHSKTRPKRRNMIPPTTPPAIAPAFDELRWP